MASRDYENFLLHENKDVCALWTNHLCKQPRHLSSTLEWGRWCWLNPRLCVGVKLHLVRVSVLLCVFHLSVRHRIWYPVGLNLVFSTVSAYVVTRRLFQFLSVIFFLIANCHRLFWFGRGGASKNIQSLKNLRLLIFLPFILVSIAQRVWGLEYSKNRWVWSL